MVTKKADDKPVEPSMEDRVAALESAVHGLQIKHGNQQKTMDVVAKMLRVTD
jgi:hypothetical protein